MKFQLCRIILSCFLLLVKESQPTPVPSSGCSSIDPATNTDECVSASEAIGTDEIRSRGDTIIPKLEWIERNMTVVFNDSSLSDIIIDDNSTYNLWRDPSTHQLVRETTDDRIDIIGASVNRFKCMAVFVADIVANESIRHLVDEEEPHFATEFQSVLEALDVLLDIKDVVLKGRLTSCNLRPADGECADYCALERDVQIKSVALELIHLPAEVKQAFELQWP